MKKHMWLVSVAVGMALVLQTFAGSLSEGLLLHYSFDTDEGHLLTDTSGSGRFGWAHGASWVQGGESGGGYRFDSNQQYIVADDVGLPSGDAPRTMALWVKLDSLASDPVTSLLTYGSQSWNQLSGIGMDWRVGRANSYFTQNGGVALSEWRMTEPGQWHHLAYVYEGDGQHHFYVDGVPGDGMSELWGPIDTVLSGAVIIGAAPNGTGPTGGVLDDVRIYDQALTAEEIAVLALPQEPEPGGDLVLHYTFDKDDGGIATDSSGYGNDGQLEGAQIIPDGVWDNGAGFDGTGAYIRVASSESLMPEEITVSTWVKLDSLPENIAVLVQKRNESLHNNEDYALQVTSAGSVRLTLGYGGGQAYVDTPALGVGQWHHVAASFLQPEMKIYLDGALVGTAQYDVPLSHNPRAALYVGAIDHLQHPMGSFTHGDLDEVRIYRVALSDFEIAELAIPPEPKLGDLVLHYTFDGDEGGIATDSSEYGNDGLLEGAQIIPDGLWANGATFDGTGAYIRVASSESLMPEEITLSAWVKITELSEEVVSLICKRNEGFHNNEDYSLQVTPSGAVRLTLGNGGWQRILDSEERLELDKWHHVAATFSQPVMKVYVDGALAATGSYDMPLQHNPEADLLIGSRDHAQYPMGPFMGGDLDEVKIFEGALTGTEIESLFLGDQWKISNEGPRDSDGDGVPDESEKRAGTNPLNPNSCLRIKSVVTSAVGDNVVVRWACVPGERYTLLWATDLVTGFSAIASNLVATGNDLAYTNMMAGAKTGYYMIQLQE